MGGKQNILSMASAAAVMITVTAVAFACRTADSHPREAAERNIHSESFEVYPETAAIHSLQVQESEPGSMTWEDAKRYCDNLVANGHKDWRMPWLEELQQIYAVVNGTTFTGETTARIIGNPDDFAPREYWSATEENDKHIHAWVVDFGRGRVYGNNKTFCNHVRCVRDR